MSESTKYLLPEDRIPKFWYNIAADLPKPLPPVLHPGTLQPIGPDDLAPLFPMALIAQEVSTEREIEIPDPVREIYHLWRPSPLVRARRLERALDTPAKIYFKNEGVSPPGSHKPNTAVAQAFYNKEEGVKRLTTETGAGQWGSSLAFAGALFGLQVDVYMVKISYQQKPYRRALMEAYGSRCVPSPSDETQSGRAILAEHPDSNGSLGIAISEAVEMAAQRDDTKYSLGSVLNHVLTHQTVIGLEAMEQMEMAGDYPDVVIGCAGGGSNFAGSCFPFVGRKLRGEQDVRETRVSQQVPGAGHHTRREGPLESLVPLGVPHEHDAADVGGPLEGHHAIDDGLEGARHEPTHGRAQEHAHPQDPPGETEHPAHGWAAWLHRAQLATLGALTVC